LKYRILVERLAVCRLAAGAPVPEWAMDGEFFCIARTSDELSILCFESACLGSAGDEAHGRSDMSVERGWVALKLEGPFPFSVTGVLSSFVQPLADARIPIFAISTFDTDYVLVKSENLEQAVSALSASGHEKLGS
jgi:uncharacterized protein